MRKKFIVSIVSYIKLFTNFRLRILTESRKIFDDPELDKLISKTIDDFYGSDEIDHRTSLNQEQQKFFDLLNSDDEIIECREIIRQILNCQSCEIRRSDVSEQLSPTGERISLYRLLRINLSYRKRVKSEYKSLQATHILPLKADILTIGKYLPLFSVLCLFAGYLHVKIIYSHYEIETSYFFSIEDYLRSSFDQIVYAIVGILYFCWRQLRNHVEFPTVPKPVQERIYRSDKRLHVFILIVAASMIFMYFADYDQIVEEYACFPHLAIFIFLLFVMHYFVAPKIVVYFESPEPVYVLFGILIFLGIVTHNAFSERCRIDRQISDKTFEFVYDGFRYTSSEHKLIGLNSNYLFLITEENTVEIFPVGGIEQFRQSVTTK